jgi:hypothetical protein
MKMIPFIIFSAVFILIGILSLYFSLKDINAAKKSLSWPKTGNHKTCSSALSVSWQDFPVHTKRPWY